MNRSITSNPLKKNNKPDSSMGKYIYNRVHRHNKNFLCTVVGPTGSGKSWSTLWIAQHIDKNFNADRIIFKAKDLMKLINEGNLKKGSVIVWDEAGIDLSNRNWQSITNRMLNALLQTFRHRNFILFFTVPYSDFVDSASKKLFHAEFETRGIDKKTNTVTIKPKLLQYNSNMRKWYRKYLKVLNDGSMTKIKRWNIPMPPQELIDQYEAKKMEFTKDLNMDISKSLDRLENVREKKGYYNKEGVDITCMRCGYNWKFSGNPNKKTVTCPGCKGYTNVPQKKPDLSKNLDISLGFSPLKGASEVKSTPAYLS